MPRKDPYTFHKSALAPLLSNPDENHVAETSKKISAETQSDFTRFLVEQDLAPLWDELISKNQSPITFTPQNRDHLHRIRLETMANYLLQKRRLLEAREILDNASIPHFIFKGAHTREIYWDDAALRPADDIDILVEPETNIDAIRAFQKHGYTFQGTPENISHECTLFHGNTCIDLHWHIFRPGRTRIENLSSYLMTHLRKDYGGHWGPSESGDLMLMLVHPVFTKYSNTSQARLVRLIELEKLINSGRVSERHIEELLALVGLKTAGWLTLTWLNMLTADNALIINLANALQPSWLKRKYLRAWLENDMARQLKHPACIQLSYTLPAHDHMMDAFLASRDIRRHRSSGQANLESMARKVFAKH